MRIVVHEPETESGVLELQKRVTDLHGHIIKNYITRNVPEAKKREDVLQAVISALHAHTSTKCYP